MANEQRTCHMTKKRLIDANDMKTAFREWFDHDDYRTMNELIDDVPTVDAVEVVHGRWMIVFDDSAGWVDMCSRCKEFGNGTPYCPNCGAKMDGGDEDG